MSLEKIEIDKKLLQYSLSQFRNIPEYVAMCEAIAKGMSTVQDCVDYLSDMIDIDKAEGVWLDYIGALVGEYRTEKIDIDKYFCVNAEDVNEEKYFYFPSLSFSGRGSKISDDLFRNKIKAKIAYNISKGTKEDMIKILKLFLNAIKVFIKRVGSMQIDVTAIGDDIDNVDKAELNDLLPNGVSINEYDTKTVLNYDSIVLPFLSTNPSSQIIRYFNGLYFVLNGARTIRVGASLDNLQVIDLGEGKYSDIAYGNDIYVLIGSDSKIAYSNDGYEWSLSNETVSRQSSKIQLIFAKDRFVYHNSFNFKYSFDGNTWTRMTNLPRLNFAYPRITYAQDKLVLLSDVIENGIRKMVSFYSTDLKTWKMGETDIDTANAGNVMDMVGTDDGFVAIGSTKYIYYSSNGIHWFNKNVQKVNEYKLWEHIIYDNYNKMYLLCGDWSVFAYSFDGLTWSKNNKAYYNGYPLGNSTYLTIIGDNEIIAGTMGLDTTLYYDVIIKISSNLQGE